MEWRQLIEAKLKENQSYDQLVKKKGDIAIAPIQENYSGREFPFLKKIITKAAYEATNRSNQDILAALNLGASALYFRTPIEEAQLVGVQKQYIDIIESDSADELKIDSDIDTYVEDMKSLVGDTKSSVLVHYHPSEDFMLSIAQLRVIHKVAMEKGKDISILSHPKLSNSEIGDHGLIELTYKVLSSMIAGVDYVLFDAHDAETLRFHINTLNIMEHEARLSMVTDPAKGSHFIEYLTQEIYAKVNGSK